MARYTYVIHSRAVPGREQDYIDWYRNQHLKDVARHPHVLSAKLFVPDFQKTYDLDAPQYVLMTMYELETDDPAATIEDIRSQSGSAGMPMTDSIDKSGMLQVVGHVIETVG